MIFVAFSKLARVALVLSLTVFLAGCESAEERAAGHFEAAQKLVSEGDTSRALIELRNVFKLNNQHKEARRLYGSLFLEQGRPAEAYRQYLRLVEQFPEDVEGLRIVSEIALTQNNWEALERYAPRGLALVPEDLTFRAMTALVSYREARENDDATKIQETVIEARSVLSEDDAQYAARQIVIDNLLSEQNLTAALDEIDKGLEQLPEDLRLHEVKLRVLNGLQDTAALGRHLEGMTRQFPENEQVRTLLIRWYMTEDKLDEAEVFLREIARDASDEDRRQGYVTVIQFLAQTDGADAAAAEVDTRIASGEDVAFFRTMRAATRFGLGQQKEAIEELQDVIATSEPSDDTRNSKATLAQILESTGDNIGARNLVEEILAEDQRHVRSLQMKASWQIEDDLIGEAVQTLRLALDQEPRNALSLTLMANAHLRDGSRDLAGERLALAVEVSGSAAQESLRYAQFLVGDGRMARAEEILVEALRQAPGNLTILQALGDIYLQQSDWLRAQSVAQQINRLGTPQAEAAARNLQTNLLQRQGKTDDSIAYLQNLIEEGDSSLATAFLVIQGHLRNGDVETAQSSLEALLSENPDNNILRLAAAGLYAITDQRDRAESIYEALIEDEPTNTAAVLALYTLLAGTDRTDEAERVLDAGISAANDLSPQLNTLKAGLLEDAGDIDGAIAIYETLYEEFSDNIILANNLSSLITTHRDDPESLERAAVVARRLRGLDVPAFQDTYGWIAYRRGNFNEALQYLEPAAAGLPDDPMAQLHLGLTYVATEQFDKARVTLERALEVAGDEPNPRLELAREALANLPAPEQ